MSMRRYIKAIKNFQLLDKTESENNQGKYDSAVQLFFFLIK